MRPQDRFLPGEKMEGEELRKRSAQESGSNEQIKAFAKNYGVTFPLIGPGAEEAARTTRHSPPHLDR